MEAVKLRKDTRLTFRANSQLKAALLAEAEREGVTLTEFITNLVLLRLGVDETQLAKLALGK